MLVQKRRTHSESQTQAHVLALAQIHTHKHTHARTHSLVGVWNANLKLTMKGCDISSRVCRSLFVWSVCQGERGGEGRGGDGQLRCVAGGGGGVGGVCACWRSRMTLL